MDLSTPPPAIPDGASIMQQFQLFAANLLKYITPTKTTGAFNMIRPDGTQPAPMGFTGEAAMAKDPPRATSTWGGGSRLTVIYGVAAPVKTPLMGPVQRY